jgi:hypothetical protein
MESLASPHNAWEGTVSARAGTDGMWFLSTLSS